MTQLAQQLATELSVRPDQIDAAIRLMDDGASVPFIARYRKEATDGLDDAQLRHLDLRLGYLRDLNARRERIIDSIRGQDRLSPELLARLNAADSKTALEDLYLPYRPKKTSKAALARDAGFAPLATRLLTEAVDPAELLVGFAHDNYPDQASQLDAMSHLVIDEWATDLPLLDLLRQHFAQDCVLKSRLAGEEKRDVGKKFRDYFESEEPLHKVASHRLLAMLRGRQENVLGLKVDGDDTPRLAEIISHLKLADIEPVSRRDLLLQSAQLLWQGKLRPHMEHSLLTEKRLAAEAEAITVFAENLRHLLLAAPAGGRCTLGVDPGLKHGVKLAVVDAAGTVVAHSVVYPFAPKNDRAGALAELERLCREHQVDLVAIGNGTASRETDSLLAELGKNHPDLNLTRITVSEAGASVYSASELASTELPDLDVSIRGAVSIARRLQDPLSELVKIDPKSIGVGQYQHDVNQTNLARMLDAVIEDCVNAVGVDVNTASPALLAHIAGLNSAVAEQIIQYRAEHGAFKTREQLMAVPRLGKRTFEQAAGFLRIRDGEQPLDASAVHPEAYPLVEKILAARGLAIADVLGRPESLTDVDASSFADDSYGLPTVQDVLTELAKPGRDPRPEFRAAKFRDDIQTLADLSEGLILEGVVTNVTNFGAFIDIGVHQDGLVHVSELSNGFVNDPQKVVKPNQIVQVRVLSVDAERKRISLSLRLTPVERPARPERNSRPARQADDNAARPPRDANRGPRRDDSRGDGRRPDRPQGERRPDQNRQDKPARAEKPREERTGSLGALLMQAGLKKSGK